MKKLLSLPPNVVDCFHELEKLDRTEWFCTSDPVGCKLGSGGGTAWLLESCRKEWAPDMAFSEWLGQEKRILLHAGGQSRRLPGYAPSGKILTPIPVFRWARGQRLGQNLLSLQLPLYERIIEEAPESIHTLIASGDVYIRHDGRLRSIPQADVVCYGMWVEPELAKNHGVFVMSRTSPGQLDYMLQKPSVEELGKLMQSHLFLMDIGVWLLSDKAVDVLMKRSCRDGSFSYYDLYAELGLALGANPRYSDEELNALSVSILPLDGGYFYHYGTSRELVSSTLAVQNLVIDQREIMHNKIKPHPAMFVQNALVETPMNADNFEIWIENSCVGKKWTLHNRSVITGVPENDWTLDLPAGSCVDVVPWGESAYVLRPYGYNDPFRGSVQDSSTLYLGKPLSVWFHERGLIPETIEKGGDLQSACLFPVSESLDDLELMLRWMVSEPHLEEGKIRWERSLKVSADDISSNANLRRLFAQRDTFKKDNWLALAKNHEHSVFYQLDLEDAAKQYVVNDLPLPGVLSEKRPLMNRVSDQMFRACVSRLRGESCREFEDGAFGLMRDGLTKSALSRKQHPVLSVYADQIVWGRSPVRIDLAGGWTDTPPYCLYEGGAVVNMAIELNGQPPLQVYVKPCKEYKVVLRSIDMGAMEVVKLFDEMADFRKIGSPFSIPKAALVLAGFQPGYSINEYASLEEQLKSFGSGIEITLLSAVPAGSGLGTSSILAATVLGTISDFCGLGWDKNEIGHRTLILEQLLTTGGGWQDQYGGVLHGVKLLQTPSGMDQNPLVKWLPDFLFANPEYRKCHLLYYTGITRTAKDILAEIVRGMFLNSSEHLQLLGEMKVHAHHLYEAIQQGNFDEMGRLVGKSWQQNKAIDSGTNPSAIESIIRKVHDYCLGYKLPGAGGGGYLYMVAKSPEAAMRIRSVLTQNPPNACARFVDMSLSDKGFQVSRS